MTRRSLSGRGEPQLALQDIDQPIPGTGEPQLAMQGVNPVTSRGWYRPRNLPHFDGAQKLQCITYRLADSLPVHVAERRADERDSKADPAYRKRIDRYLDTGHGSCCLSHSEIAQAIVDTWTRFDPERYRLHAWVVMPNHVHVLIAIQAAWSLAKIVQSWKSWTGKRIKQVTTLSTGWQRDYWDRYIRDEMHYLRAIAYIHANPVQAGLCRTPEEWLWSSANIHYRGELGLASPRGSP
ncbi:hypothetical protein LBMAG53_21060 [Planctomycetota bacterium]|nr:hypothetical protein LBMAG53_21060 [Planctomycetota bacterium]